MDFTEPFSNPQEESLHLLEKVNHNAIGLIKDHVPVKGIVLLSPAKLAVLKAENIQTWTERRFGAHAAFSDMEYADAGADILENTQSVMQSSNIIAKLEPFTLEEISYLRNNQVIFSTLDLDRLSPEYFALLKKKNITAFALDRIEDFDGNSLLNDIFYREESPIGITLSLSNFILPLLLAVAKSSNLRATIQTNPSLFQALYCFNGEITQKNIAEKLQLPWRDFTSLSWNLN